jgi:ABC-type iron transport system FetAB permease component
MAAMLLSGANPIYASIYQFVTLAMILASSETTTLVVTLLIRGPHVLGCRSAVVTPGGVTRA